MRPRRELRPWLDGRWNHNTHYYPLAVAVTPCRRALDVGCGDGLLLHILAQRCDEVVGVDPWTDPHVADDLPNVTVVQTDFLSADLEPASFDLVCSFTVIHHMDVAAALDRMVSLVAPGGRLVVTGIARYTPLRWVQAGVGIPFHQVMSRVRGFYQHPAPVADTTWTITELRRLARRVAPGSRFRIRLYWRWSLEWTRPTSSPGSRPPR